MTFAARGFQAKILVNATTITVGGGVQAAVSFVEYAARLDTPGSSFVFALSPAVYGAIAADVRSDTRIRLFEGSTAHPIAGLGLRRELLQLEKIFAPHLIYSIGFPSYVVFENPEAGRYTNGWEICSFHYAWKLLPTTERIARSLRSMYRLHWARHARYYETQTEIAKAGIVRTLRVKPERVFVSPNSANPRFAEAGQGIDRPLPVQAVPRIFCLSAAFWHKNLTIIPAVAAILKRRYGLQSKFVLTLPPDSRVWQSIARKAAEDHVSHLIENLGPLNLDGCVREFRRAACLFLPTLAEIFSATYLEAMAMRVPVVTTDLDFARAICADAAGYYDPLSSEAAARTIFNATTDNAVRDRLVANGIRRLGAFPDPATKHRLLLDWLVRSASSDAESA